MLIGYTFITDIMLKKNLNNNIEHTSVENWFFIIKFHIYGIYLKYFYGKISYFHCAHNYSVNQHFNNYILLNY